MTNVRPIDGSSDDPVVFGEIMRPSLNAESNVRDMDGFCDQPIARFLPAPLVSETKAALEWQDWCYVHLGTVSDSGTPVG